VRARRHRRPRLADRPVEGLHWSLNRTPRRRYSSRSGTTRSGHRRGTESRRCVGRTGASGYRKTAFGWVLPRIGGVDLACRPGLDRVCSF
jgi:hypothetical protein